MKVAKKLIIHQKFKVIKMKHSISYKYLMDEIHNKNEPVNIRVKIANIVKAFRIKVMFSSVA